jgi:hypothetical protein
MRPLALIALAAVLPACIVHEDGPTVYGPPDNRSQFALRFDVLLDGYACEDVPEIDVIHVSIDGPSGTVDTDVPCPHTGEQIYLPGYFRWSLAAIDANGYLLYEGEGMVDVIDRSPLVQVDLVPADTGMGALTFRWKFGAAGARCAEVGVRDVEVTIGDATFTMPCAPESADEGAAFDVPAGMYSWTLVARGSDVNVLYAATGTFVIRSGGVVDLTTVLTARVQPPDPGELLVSWTFDGFTSCAVYEVEWVYVQVWSGNTPLLGEDDLGVKLPCSQHEVLVSPLGAGPYSLDVHGEGRQGGHPQITFAALGVPVDVASGMTTEADVDLQAL